MATPDNPNTHDPIDLRGLEAIDRALRDGALAEGDEDDTVWGTHTDEAMGEGQSGPPYPWNPAAMTEHDWTELAGWVSWLRSVYGLELTIPECWYRHPAHVAEVAGLRAWWRAAYQLPKAGPDTPTVWHEHLDSALGRLGGRWQVPCRGSRHDPNAEPQAEVGLAGFARWRREIRDSTVTVLPDEDGDGGGPVD